ncbi:MAG TPA: ABC transporter permease, partial [Mycoplana sp.]|nr:ABC transporter permease [Mycoplana sp.]
MTDIAASPTHATSKTVSRSLFQLALIRFRRNKAAMAGCVTLLLIALFSFVGPLFVPHAYDQVFPSYVSVPPSLQPRPDTSTLQEAIEGVASRARVKLDSFAVEGQMFTATISADDPIDPRATRYFDRANEFRDTKVETT